MRDYSYQDMLKMQEDAALRVREMKKRATLVMDDSSRNDVNTGMQEQKGLLNLLLSDSDAVLVIAILALLSTENSDSITELALLYILL